MIKLFNICCLVVSLSSILVPLASSQCLSANDKRPVRGQTDMSGIIDFNLDLFREIVPTGLNQNFIFSPYSIWNALTLAYFGSDRATERQFRRVLRVGDKIATLKQWRALEYLYAMRPETTVNNTFIVANRAYFDNSVFLRYCIRDLLHNEIETLDFSQPQKAARTINNFVSETTNGAIKELISASDVSNARMVLANAAYFKGTWALPFDTRDTRPAPFYNLDSTQGEVDMMMQFGNFKYGFNDELEADVVEIPYSGNVLSMFIFLPYTIGVDNFNDMIHDMTAEKLEAIFASMYITNMRLSIPKFSIDSHVGHQLMEALKTMGLKNAFNTKKADFSDFTMFEKISLDKSVHKAYINVNEEGTEAAAATAFVSTKLGGSPSLECNRPFVYMIRDNETNNLLFIGTFKSAPLKKSNVPSFMPPPNFLFQTKQK